MTRPFRKSLLAAIAGLLLLLAMALAAGGAVAYRARQEQQSVAAIEKLGGSVYYHHQVDGHIFDESAEPPGPAWLRRYFGENCLAKVHTVWLQHWDVPAWKHRPVTDADLAVLDSLSSLQRIMLDDSQVTDAGLKRLQRHQLKELHLNRLAITDTGIERVTEIESLVSLNLGGTQVTDRSLDRLRNLPNLQWVWAGSTKITPEAIERFNRERGAVVVHDGKGAFIPPP